jgi:predicted amidophosphoribosyltransferase
VVYDATARAFLLRAKFARRPELLTPLGTMVAVALELSGFAADIDLIVPAPSHPWATVRRGFQPARELARPVAKRLGVPVAPRCLRLSWRAPLSGRRLAPSSRQRRAVRGIGVRGSVQGRRVLLVDDVMTTGALLGACGRALLQAGADDVRAAVWARALPAGWRVV